MALSAAFDELYARNPGRSLSTVSDPRPLDTLTIRGLSECRSNGRHAEVTVTTPKTLTSYVARNTSAVASTPHSTITPALLTSTSSRPPSINPTAAATVSESVTSSGTTRMSNPAGSSPTADGSR